MEQFSWIRNWAYDIVVLDIYLVQLLILFINCFPDNFRYQEQAASLFGGMSTIPKLSINDKFTLNQTDASYSLSLECQTSIGNII